MELETLQAMASHFAAAIKALRRESPNTKVEGIYSADPVNHPDATRYAGAMALVALMSVTAAAQGTVSGQVSIQERPGDVTEDLARRHAEAFGFARELLSSLWRVRRLGIDATVDMEFFARASAILALLTGAGRRCGLHRFEAEGPYRGDLLTHRLQWNPYLHTSAAYLVLVEALLHDPAECPMLKRPASGQLPAPPPFVPSADEVLMAWFPPPAGERSDR